MGEEERRKNAFKICFQKVIPPTLSASNATLVSGVRSCQSNNGWQTAPLTGTEHVPRLAYLHLFTKSALKISRWIFWRPGFRNFRAKAVAFSFLLNSQPIRPRFPYCCSDSNHAKNDFSCYSRMVLPIISNIFTTLSRWTDGKSHRYRIAFPIKVISLRVLKRAVKIDQS